VRGNVVGTPWERARDGTEVGSVRNAECDAKTVGSVRNADCDAQTVGSVVNAYMHGAPLAKGATAAIEHSERWKTILIDYIPHKPTDDPYAYPYPSPHHRSSSAALIQRRSHPPSKSSTSASSYRPTHPSLVSRSQAHLANVLDNDRSSKEGELTACIAGGSVVFSRLHIVVMSGIIAFVGRERAKKRGYGNCGISTQEKVTYS
jgi:chorismate synthase